MLSTTGLLLQDPLDLKGQRERRGREGEGGNDIMYITQNHNRCRTLSGSQSHSFINIGEKSQ